MAKQLIHLFQICLLFIFTSLLFTCGSQKDTVPNPNEEENYNPNPPNSDSIVGKRNILLIIADDMGIDLSRQYSGITGTPHADLPVTPTIERLRRSGVTFNNAWASPVCSPTRAGLLTGRYSFRTTVADAREVRLPLAEETLPELIASSAYVSGLFGKWHLGGGPDGPRNQGFNDHYGSLESGIADYVNWEKYMNGTSVGLQTQYATEATVEDAASWIKSQTSNWLAVVSFNAPHTTSSAHELHMPTPECDGVDAAVKDGSINAMIKCMDRHIRWLLAELTVLGEIDNTTIIFVGDNGTEARSILGPFDDSPTESHKGNVYEGGLRVPFIISDGYHFHNKKDAPASSGLGRIVNPGRHEDHLAHTVDIFSTVADIAGVSSSAADSRSMVPYLLSPSSSSQREFMYSDRCTFGPHRDLIFQAAIRNDEYKVIYRLDYGVTPLSPVFELYEVSDLEEADELYAKGPAAGALAWGAFHSLETELYSLWASEGFNPLDGCP